MPSRFGQDFFRKLYEKTKSFLGLDRVPQGQIDPIYQDPEDIVDDEFILDEYDPINLPQEEEMGEIQDLRRIQDPNDIEFQLQDMIDTPPEERNIPDFEVVDSDDPEDVIIERKPELEDEEEPPIFPDGIEGFELKISYAMDRNLTLNVNYIGPYSRFGPNYKVRPVEWGRGEHGKFVWVKDLEDIETSIKMFYLKRFRSVDLLNG